MDEAVASNCEIASVFCLDIVGWSRESIDRQAELLSRVWEAVRSSVVYKKAGSAEELILLPSGDGAAVVFPPDAVAAVRCALDLSAVLQTHAKVRVGIHMGPVRRHLDIKDEITVVGGGINVAQRVMDFGDAGHILLSSNIAEVLLELDEWRGSLQDLGTHEARHGIKVHIYNLYNNGLGNTEIPHKVCAHVKRNLREGIVASFSLEEFEELVADVEAQLQIKYSDARLNVDILGGTGLPARALKLIQYLDRRGQLGILVTCFRRVRPGAISGCLELLNRCR